jgi:hypothetical protein
VRSLQSGGWWSAFALQQRTLQDGDRTFPNLILWLFEAIYLVEFNSVGLGDRFHPDDYRRSPGIGMGRGQGLNRFSSRAASTKDEPNLSLFYP